MTPRQLGKQAANIFAYGTLLDPKVRADVGAPKDLNKGQIMRYNNMTAVMHV